jgi:hypothetical protein
VNTPNPSSTQIRPNEQKENLFQLKINYAI